MYSALVRLCFVTSQRGSARDNSCVLIIDVQHVNDDSKIDSDKKDEAG